MQPWPLGAGGLANFTGTVPTIRGYITVTASPAAVDVAVPCNSFAELCAPRSAADAAPFTTDAFALLLDGELVDEPHMRGGHLCVPRAVGCGAGGSPRRLRVQRHMQPLPRQTAP